MEPHIARYGRRHNRHYARSGSTATPSYREDSTSGPQTESLSTAQTFFRLRGYKGRNTPVKEESTSTQDDSNFKYEEGSAGGNLFSQTILKDENKQHLPPGMTHDLMNALLSQQPQTFDYGYKSPSRSDNDNGINNNNNHDSHVRPEPTRPSRKSQKKYRNQIQSDATEKSKKRANNKNRDSFNVGYSIGFGSPTTSTATENPMIHRGPNEVVLGKPKSRGSNYKLHVNGENSVWKEIHPGVEMSEDTVKNTPLSLAIPEKTHYYQDEPEIGLLSGHPGQSVYYINGLQQDYNVPTTGQATFDHAHALGQSNTFDFSNAVSHPVSTHLAQSSQSKQDTPSKVKTPKYIQPIHFNKPTSYQSFQSSDIPQKSVVSFSNQQFAYLPYSLDLNKPSSHLSSRSPSEFISPTSQNSIKPQKNQASLASNLAGGYDLSHFMGFGTPVPIQNVFIPGKNEGEGEMVPAIVIPISQLSGFESFGSGLNYVNEASDGYQPFGGDVFNVVPHSPPKQSHKAQMSGKFGSGKPHTPRINDNKPMRGGKGGYPGIKSLINLSAPEHLDSPRKPNPHSKHPRSDSFRPHPGQGHKIMAPKFSQMDQTRDKPSNLKRSPSNRSARLAQLQSELNSILAEEMYRKNRSNRRNIVTPPRMRVY